MTMDGRRVEDDPTNIRDESNSNHAAVDIN